MNKIFKKNILELKILKPILIIPILFISLALFFVFINLSASPIEMAANMIEFLIVVCILISAWIGAYSISDLLSEDLVTLLATYKLNIKKIIFSRLVKAIVIYSLFSFLLSIFLSLIFQNNELLNFITTKMMFIKFLVEGIPTLILAVILAILLNNFLLGFILVSTICISLVSIWEMLLSLTLVNRFMEVINIYSHYDSLMNTQSIGMNFIIKSIIFSIIFIVILTRINIAHSKDRY